MANAYKQAGVDIEAGYEAVERMKKHVATYSSCRCVWADSVALAECLICLPWIKRACSCFWNRWSWNEIEIAFQMDQHDTIG